LSSQAFPALASTTYCETMTRWQVTILLSNSHKITGDFVVGFGSTRSLTNVTIFGIRTRELFFFSDVCFLLSRFFLNQKLAEPFLTKSFHIFWLTIIPSRMNTLTHTSMKKVRVPTPPTIYFFAGTLLSSAYCAVKSATSKRSYVSDKSLISPLKLMGTFCKTPVPGSKTSP
jgi:hypothetical protein